MLTLKLRHFIFLSALLAGFAFGAVCAIVGWIEQVLAR